MVPALLLNVIQSLIVDSESTLAKEHVTKIMEDNLSEDQIKMIDSVVEEMPENNLSKVKDFFS